MLKLFFNKDSILVKAAELLGVILLLILIISWWPSGKSIAHQVAFFLFIFEYLAIRFFTLFRWYDADGQNAMIWSIKNIPKGDDCSGIELHFLKVLVPTAYIVPLVSLLLLLGVPGYLLYFTDFLLAVILHISFILIYFHKKDKETLPVNYFTQNKYPAHTSHINTENPAD